MAYPESPRNAVTALMSMMAILALSFFSAPRAQQHTPEEWLEILQQELDDYDASHPLSATTASCGFGGNESQGIAALYKGYTQRTLTAADIDAIHKWRVLRACDYGTGEYYYLPSSWSFHPYLTPTTDYVSASGTLYNKFRKANVGKQYHDFRLRRFEAALKSPRYRDAIPAEYQQDYYLRPGGKLAWIEPMTFYDTATIDGVFKVITKPENLEMKPGDNPADFVRARDVLDAGKPILIWANDPADKHPVRDMFQKMEYLYQAYKDVLGVYYVATGPTDWNLPSTGETGCKDYMTGPTVLEPIHSHHWSEEEKARRIMNRYIQEPYASFPTLLDDMGQTFKHNYGAPGGQNFFMLIDVTGKIVRIYRESLNWHYLNLLEQAIEATLQNGGICPDTDYQQDAWSKNPTPVDEVWICGPIVAVTGTKITMRRLDHDSSEYVGYYKWIEKKRRGGQLYLNDEVTAVMNHVGTWLARTNQEYTVDAGSSVLLNGTATPVSQLRKGDFIGVRYPIAQEGGEIKPSLARVARFVTGSTDVGATGYFTPGAESDLEFTPGSPGRIALYSLSGKLLETKPVRGARLSDMTRALRSGNGLYIAKVTQNGRTVSRRVELVR